MDRIQCNKIELLVVEKFNDTTTQRKVTYAEKDGPYYINVVNNHLLITDYIGTKEQTTTIYKLDNISRYKIFYK